MKKDILQLFSTNMVKMLTMLVTSFLIPVILSVNQFGYYKLFALFASYIGLFHLGFCDGVFIKYGGNDINQIDKEELSNENFSFTCYSLGISFIVITIGIIKKNVLLLLWGIDIFPVLMLPFYTYIYQATGIFNKYSKTYTLYSILSLLSNIALIFLLKSEEAIYYIFNIIFIDYLIYLGVSFDFRKSVGIKKGKFYFDSLYVAMKSGILLMLGNMAYIIFSGIDKWYIKLFLGLNFFAYFSFSSQLLSLFNMIVNPISLALFNYMKKRNSKDFEYSCKVNIIYIMLFMLTGVFILNDIIRLFIVKYVPSIYTNNILFVSQIFMLTNMAIYVNLFKVYKMQKIYFINLLYCIFFSVGINFIFIYFFKSIESIALGTLLSMLFWELLNSRYFKYLRLRYTDFCFFVICIFVYTCCTIWSNNIYGAIIYMVVFLVTLKILLPEKILYIKKNIFKLIDK